MIPNTLTLPEIQSAFRQVQTALKPLSTGLIDLNGRRVVNAGKAIQPFDYVRLEEVESLIAAVPSSSSEIRSVIAGPLVTPSTVRVGTFTTRGAPAAHNNELFFASDLDYIGWVSTGAVWKYVSGVRAVAQADIAAFTANLGTDDAGCLVNVTDFTHLLRWTGSATEFAPGDDGSNYFIDAPSAPLGKTVQLCDGTATTYLKADGTTGSYTTLNLSGHYRKSVTASADALVAAVAPTLSGASATENAHTHAVDPGSTTSGAPSATTTVDNVGGGSTVAVGSNTHTHDTDIASFSSGAGSAHSHGAGTYAISATGEPAAFKVLTYFRR